MRWTPLKRTLIRGGGILSLSCTLGCAHEDAWTEKDTHHFTAYAIAVTADSYSTSRAISKGPYFHEENPFVRGIAGSRPSDDELIAGTILFATMNYFIARALPDEYRRKYLGLWTFGHSAMTIHNIRSMNDYPSAKKNPFEDVEPWR